MIKQKDAGGKNSKFMGGKKKSFITKNLITSANIILSAWNPLEFQLD